MKVFPRELMKKFIHPIKSILIIALAVLAVYQVGRLWFVNFTDRHFVMYLEARFPSAAPDGQSAFAQPFRIIYGAGNGRFSMRYSDISDSAEWAFGEAVLGALLNSGEFLAVSDMDMAQLLSRNAVVFEYAFDMCAEIFVQALGHRNANLLTDYGMETFTSIVVQPPDALSPSPAVDVSFVRGLQIWRYALPLPSWNHAADYAGFSVPSVNPAQLHFVWANGGFVPRVMGGGFSYSGVVVENSFRDAQGLFTLSHIRSRVEPLFDNPASIFPSVSVDDVYTFSNRNTMVRFLENAVLEYTSYRTIGRGAQENFMTDFSVALAFVAADPFVENEMYLAYHNTRGRAHVFHFNYVIDNRPLVLTAPWHTRPYPHCREPLIAPIEVTVDQGRVVRYRRIVYTFHTEGTSWMDASELEHDEFFRLGFPIGGGPNLKLQMFE